MPVELHELMSLKSVEGFLGPQVLRVHRVTVLVSLWLTLTVHFWGFPRTACRHSPGTQGASMTFAALVSGCNS